MSNTFNKNSVDKNLLFLYLDVETTGLDSTKAGLVEVSGLFEFQGQILQEFELLINPFTYPREVEIQEKALAVNNRTIPEIQTFLNQKECIDWLCLATKQYTEYYNCNRPFLIGYNTGFDTSFIQEWFNVNNIRFSEYFQYKYIDVLQLSMLLGYMGIIDPFDNNLKDMCLKFGIDLTNAHTAIADIKATRELYHKMLSILPFSGWLNPTSTSMYNLMSVQNWGSKPLIEKLGLQKNDIVKEYGG